MKEESKKDEEIAIPCADDAISENKSSDEDEGASKRKRKKRQGAERADY